MSAPPVPWKPASTAASPWWGLSRPGTARCCSSSCACCAAAAALRIPGCDALLTATASALEPRRAVDVLLFNPPYVPSEEPAAAARGLARAWAGGPKGIDVLEALVPRLDGLLARPHGAAYIIVEQRNGPAEVGAMLVDAGWAVDIVDRMRAGGERLYVYRATRRE